MSVLFMQLADVAEAVDSGFALECCAEQDGKLRVWEKGSAMDMVIEPVWSL
jgi:hypothetical protein